MSFKPNSEQMAVMDALGSPGKSVFVINALAGTGKTTTLELLANGPLAGERITYITFNARAAKEARGRFGRNTLSQTAHSHAWRSHYPGSSETMAEVFAGRLTQGSLYGDMALIAEDDAKWRGSFAKVAGLLGIGRFGWRAGILPVLSVVDEFCKSPRLEISIDHIPSAIRARAMLAGSKIDLNVLLKEAERLWEHQVSASSDIPISHGTYLKLASLDPEPFSTDIIFFDEAQDASAPMLAMIDAHAAKGGRLVMVGDKYQHIYAWAGALNSIDSFASKYAESSLVLPLCQSYRFGSDIADAGNVFLSAMRSDYRLAGLGPHGSSEHSGIADAILFRSNLKMITEILAAHKQDPERKFHVVGGTGEMVNVLGDLARLYSGEIPRTGDLSGFASWDELREFTDTPLGAGYAALVSLVEMRGGAVSDVMGILKRSQFRPEDADVILSTAHKAKGAQWGSVKLSSEFGKLWDNSVVIDADTGQQSYLIPEAEEIALQYVAATRSQKLLVHGGLLGKVQDHLRRVSTQRGGPGRLPRAVGN